MLSQSSKKSIVLNKMELSLFKYLYENKVATCDQIRRDIYTRYARRSVQNRLAKIFETGFIDRQYCHGLGNKAAYSLTKKGFANFVLPLATKLRRDFKSYSPLHDLDLVDIRFALSASEKVKTYYPENLISGADAVSIDNFFIETLRPDAAIEVELSGTNIWLALEYEHTIKSPSRYKDLFKKYYKIKSVAGVLYICASQDILEYVSNLELRSVTTDIPKFYYGDFSKWNEFDVKMFTNQKGVCISL